MCTISNTGRVNVSEYLGRIPPLHSLSETEAFIIVDGLYGLAVPWSVERHETDEGRLLIMVMDKADRVFVIDRDVAGIQISFMAGETFYPGTARYSAAEAVLRELQTRVDSTAHVTHTLYDR